MHRVLIAPTAVHDGSITITDLATLHHLLDVLRVQVGEPLECFDGQGNMYAGTILRRSRSTLIVTVDRQTEEPSPGVSITLAQALVKPERFDWGIQKATELGVARIVPLVTARTTIRPASVEGARHARWQRIVESAATQCGRASVPRIELPQRFDQFVQTLTPSSAMVFMPTLATATVPLREALRGVGGARELIALIGPEGDFTPEEALLAQRHGAQLVSLGRMTLRSETAAIAAIVTLQHAVGLL